jgi:putative intracellular protease/amidase
MRKHKLVALGSAAALVLAVGGGAMVLAAPDAPVTVSAEALEPIPADEHSRTIAAMKPPKRSRPLIAVVGQNDGTETTDYLIPYAVLAESGAADVLALATEDRPLRLRPALTIRAHATTAAFDDRYPHGADYVVVPAITDRDNPEVVAWIRAQAAKGATIVAICAGAVTVSEAGLLSGRNATGHWHDVANLRNANPTMRWVRDRRYVADRGVVTTTGVSASVPVSLALVEAIAGRGRAAELARRYGVTNWDARHDSDAFHLDRRMLRTGLANKAGFWNREAYGVPVAPGVDEIGLGLMADAWSRTFRSRAFAVSRTGEPIRTRGGLTLLADREPQSGDGLIMLPPPGQQAGRALPAALAGIERRYGRDTASWVALQLEYPWRGEA